jgi:hypothetical protein
VCTQKGETILLLDNTFYVLSASGESTLPVCVVGVQHNFLSFHYGL